MIKEMHDLMSTVYSTQDFNNKSNEQKLRRSLENAIDGIKNLATERKNEAENSLLKNGSLHVTIFDNEPEFKNCISVSDIIDFYKSNKYEDFIKTLTTGKITVKNLDILYNMPFDIGSNGTSVSIVKIIKVVNIYKNFLEHELSIFFKNKKKINLMSVDKNTFVGFVKSLISYSENIFYSIIENFQKTLDVVSSAHYPYMQKYSKNLFDKEEFMMYKTIVSMAYCGKEINNLMNLLISGKELKSLKNNSKMSNFFIKNPIKSIIILLGFYTNLKLSKLFISAENDYNTAITDIIIPDNYYNEKLTTSMKNIYINKMNFINGAAIPLSITERILRMNYYEIYDVFCTTGGLKYTTNNFPYFDVTFINKLKKKITSIMYESWISDLKINIG